MKIVVSHRSQIFLINTDWLENISNVRLCRLRPHSETASRLTLIFAVKPSFCYLVLMVSHGNIGF